MPTNPDTSPSVESFAGELETIYDAIFNSWDDHVTQVDLQGIYNIALRANEELNLPYLAIDEAQWNSPAAANAKQFLTMLQTRSSSDFERRVTEIDVVVTVQESGVDVFP